MRQAGGAWAAGASRDRDQRGGAGRQQRAGNNTALQKENDKLKAQLKLLQAAAAGPVEQEDPASDSEDAGEKIAKLQTAYDAVRDACGADCAAALYLGGQLAAARQAKLAAKPMYHQTLAAQRCVDKKLRAAATAAKLVADLTKQQ